MKLSHIDKGTKLIIFEDMQDGIVSDGHEAVVRYIESDRQIVVSCPWLHDMFDSLNLDSRLNVSFDQGAVVHSFVATAQSKLRGGSQVMLQQLTEIETKERRKFNRDELRISVAIYGLPESNVSSQVHDMSDMAPEFTDVTYDISSGGLCVITNEVLNSRHDPYYLLEFNLTSRDRFIIPSKLVRRSNYPHTKLGKYDYGFQFIYDNLPEEKGRLTTSILNRKIKGY